MAEVQVTGTEEVALALAGFSKKVISKIERKAVRAAGKPVLSSAKRLAPVAEEHDVHDLDHMPGTLRKSLRLRALKRTASRRRAGIYGVAVQSGKEAHAFKGETFYGGFVEFGTVHQDPQWFMQTAAKENERRSAGIFREEIRRYITEEGKRRG